MLSIYYKKKLVVIFSLQLALGDGHKKILSLCNGLIGGENFYFPIDVYF